MTLEELERWISQAIVDDYQQEWDELRRQRHSVLWEHAVANSGVPQYLGSPDDLKLLLMKATNRKTPHHGYRTSEGSRLSFQGRWYVCPGLLSRLAGPKRGEHANAEPHRFVKPNRAVNGTVKGKTFILSMCWSN
jgi:hypothetical protein